MKPTPKAVIILKEDVSQCGSFGDREAEQILCSATF